MMMIMNDPYDMRRHDDAILAFNFHFFQDFEDAEKAGMLVERLA